MESIFFDDNSPAHFRNDAHLQRGLSGHWVAPWRRNRRSRALSNTQQHPQWVSALLPARLITYSHSCSVSFAATCCNRGSGQVLERHTTGVGTDDLIPKDFFQRHYPLMHKQWCRLVFIVLLSVCAHARARCVSVCKKDSVHMKLSSETMEREYNETMVLTITAVTNPPYVRLSSKYNQHRNDTWAENDCHYWNVFWWSSWADP